jgi:hypothetical protein
MKSPAQLIYANKYVKKKRKEKKMEVIVPTSERCKDQ